MDQKKLYRMVKIISPIIEGYFLKRYKRFFADILLKDSQEIVTAHCPNPGAMLGLLEANSPVLLSPSTNPKRKLGYTLQAIQIGHCWVGVNTALPNELVAAALTNNAIPNGFRNPDSKIRPERPECTKEYMRTQRDEIFENRISKGEGYIPQLRDYSTVQREIKYGLNSRIDFLLTAPDKPNCYVEVKNVHLKRFDYAEFPDCVTTRGAKHLQELSTLVEQGHRCMMVYVVQRDDCTGFQLAADLDPIYAKAAEVAKMKGVETIVLYYSLNLIDNQLMIQLKD